MEAKDRGSRGEVEGIGQNGTKFGLSGDSDRGEVVVAGGRRKVNY